MKTILLVLVSVASVAVAADGPAALKAAPSPAARIQVSDLASQRAVLDKYCVVCHNTKLKTGGLMLDQLDLTHLAEHAEIGEKVIRKLRAGMMPPSGMPRPDRAVLDALVSSLENELDRNAVTYLPAPGLHRLNRTE